MIKTLGFCVEYHRISWVYGRQNNVVGSEHKNASKMKSTWSQLHKTSKIIEKFHLGMKLCCFEKMTIFF